MSVKNKLEPTVRHTFDCATLSASYQRVFSGGFATDLVIYKMYNSSVNDIDISYDGVNDHDTLPGSGAFILDVQANKEGDRCAWPAGRELYVKGTAAVGTITESGYSIRGV